MSDRQDLPPLYLITDRHQASPDLDTALEAALRGGVKLVQLREKDLPAAQLHPLGTRIRRLTRRYGAKLLVNGNPQLARQIEADGVQLGTHSCSILSAREQLGSEALIGYSAHSIEELFNAEEQGANFVCFSPIYATPSKQQYGPPQGIEKLRRLCHQTNLPVFALGGIKPAHITEVLDAGASGIALISAIFSAPEPQTTTRAILRQISAARKKK